MNAGRIILSMLVLIASVAGYIAWKNTTYEPVSTYTTQVTKVVGIPGSGELITKTYYVTVYHQKNVFLDTTVTGIREPDEKMDDVMKTNNLVRGMCVIVIFVSISSLLFAITK